MMFGREKRGDARRGQAIAVVTSLVAALLLVTSMTGCGAARVDATAPSETPKAVQEGTAEDAARSTKVSPDLEACTLERVVDGDTIVVNLDGRSEKVRLIGIDAPESVHPDAGRNTAEGDEASAYLKSLVSPGQTVYLQKDVSDTDRYGRLLRYVWLEVPSDPDDASEVSEKMLNAAIVASGHAQAKDYAPDTRYSRMLHSL